MNRQVKLNTSSVKFTPSALITFYELDTNFSVRNEEELLRLDEVKAVLNAHSPIIKRDPNGWSIGISTPLKDIRKQSRRV